MVKRICFSGIAAFLLFVSAGFAQYTMDLTGVGDGANADGAYVGPYQGTISQGTNQIYSGNIICDDFSTESFLDTPWSATATNAGSLNGSEKFNSAAYYNATVGHTTTQQDYNAVAWLANSLLASGNVTNPTAQINLSFAIWDIFGGATTDPDGGAMADITAAFNAVKGGYVGTNVEVFSPVPSNASQEFLVVNGPAISAPEPAAFAILGADLLSVLAIVFVLRRRRVQA